MTGKKQLEDIKERVLVDRVYYKYLDGTKGHWGKTYTLDEEDYKYLYEQAERVQELEELVEGYKTELMIKDNAKKRANQQNKHYQEALKNIITLWISSTDATNDTWLAHKMSEVARKALEGEK